LSGKKSHFFSGSGFEFTADVTAAESSMTLLLRFESEIRHRIFRERYS
jgi:hypothetical protein